MDQILNQTAPVALRLDTLTINLLISLALASVVAWFYTQYGRSLSNRSRFAQNLPALAVITVLIISVVQSSLALSLGLVGALSIVRFRTAIKEPEELVYLFLAIAIGLGIGANQRVPTVLATVIILAYFLVRTMISGRANKSNLYLSVNIPDGDVDVSAIEKLVQQHTNSVELRRLDTSDELFHAAFLLQLNSTDTLTALVSALRATYPNAEISFVEQDNMLTA
jgi:uncharacterized membrane protein YhiD involved in acid resistance